MKNALRVMPQGVFSFIFLYCTNVSFSHIME